MERIFGRAHRPGDPELVAEAGEGPEAVLGPGAGVDTAPSRQPRVEAAISRASAIRPMRMWSAMDQPRTLRLKQSSTVPVVEEHPACEREIRDVAMHLRHGSVAVKSRWKWSGTGEVAGSGTVVRTRLRRRMSAMENVRMIRATRFSLTAALLAELGGHARGGVSAAGLAVDLADLLGQDTVPVLPAARSSAPARHL
ncbi:hypothetical protein ACW4TU_44420 [Streptomyces sp. QTS52]